MDAIRASAATAATSSTATTTTDTSSSTATETKQSFATLFAAAEKDLKSGEKLTKVTGHEFARIKGGERDDMCVNLSGNARNGKAFDLISRGGRQFHVYGGTGADHTVVEVGKQAGTTTTAAGTTTTDASSGGTTASGTTPTGTSATSTASSTSS